MYIALDNERVTRHVPVFEDLRRVQAGPDGPGVDYTPPRSKYFHAWGAESFTSGQHYWEVDVAGCCNWAIGLCNDSWTRDSDMVLDSEGIFLLLCTRENNQCSFFTTSPLSPQYVRKTLGHVGEKCCELLTITSIASRLIISLCILVAGNFMARLLQFNTS